MKRDRTTIVMLDGHAPPDRDGPSWRCPANCGRPLTDAELVTDARGRAWHALCAADALGQITRRDETRPGAVYWWTFPYPRLAPERLRDANRKPGSWPCRRCGKMLHHDKEFCPFYSQLPRAETMEQEDGEHAWMECQCGLHTCAIAPWWWLSHTEQEATS